MGENFHPLFGGNIDVPSYVAFQQTPLQVFWPAVVFVIASLEVFSVFTFEDPNVEGWAIRADHEPGTLGSNKQQTLPVAQRTEFFGLHFPSLKKAVSTCFLAAGMKP